MSFEPWYRDYHPRLVAALTVVAGDGSVGREAADEALVRAYEKWARVEKMTSPEAWTYTVGDNVLRRRARRVAAERRLLRRTGERIVAPGELRPDVWDAVRRLPRRQREAIALRYVLDLSERQVADALGVAEGTASATLATARRSLARALEDDDLLGGN
jgi:RNA polymerase sigma-70 factor (ECF subfamily)